MRAALPLGTDRPERVEELLRSCVELGGQTRAAIGVSQLRSSGAEAARAYQEAVDAATIGRALLHEGGAIAYSQLGAYRYLVHIAAEQAPRDRMREAVDELIAYDNRRSSSLLDTLERYLSERRSVIESARALFIHPNTLRQRLARIEELTGVELDQDDLLSLELAIKLARLHGQRARRAVSRGLTEEHRHLRLPAHRCGSWVHIRSATRRLRSGSRPSRSPGTPWRWPPRRCGRSLYASRSHGRWRVCRCASGV